MPVRPTSLHVVARLLAAPAGIVACLFGALALGQQPVSSDPMLQTPPLELPAGPPPWTVIPASSHRDSGGELWLPLQEVGLHSAGPPKWSDAETATDTERKIIPVQATEPADNGAAGQPSQPETDTPGVADAPQPDIEQPESQQPDRQQPDQQQPDQQQDYPQMASADNGLDRYALSRGGVSSRSLARVPNMFGDFFSPGGQVCYDLSREVVLGSQTVLVPTLVPVVIPEGSLGDGEPDTDIVTDAVVDVPTEVPIVQDVNLEGCIQFAGAGGFRRMKIAEHNSTLPQDRGLFVYSHFHNALQGDVFELPDASGPLATGTQQRSLDRYLFGLEKTFNCGLGSVEVRVPLTGSDLGFRTDDLSIDSNALGNVALIVKHLIYQDETFAAGLGLGLDLPTGGDVSGRLAGLGFHLENDATRVLPFVGFAATPTEDWFWLAFAQFDIPANGNPVLVDDGTGRRDVGRLNDPALLFLDLNTGCWLWREHHADVLAGLAAVLELHYTTTLEDPDVVAATFDGGASRLQFGNAGGRFDVLNLTTGLHAVSAAGPAFRVAGVFPLRSEANRFFDAEIQAAVVIPY